MKKLITILFLGLNFVSFAETIDLFVWAGQSNALGRKGDAAGYPADVNNLDNQIRFNWTVASGNNSGGWTTMEAQTGYFPTGHFGPEVTFSRKLVQAGYNPAIFKYTQGATSISQHWQGHGDGGLYDNMVTALTAAITTLENQGHTVNLRGFIWIQGESDSNSQTAASAYNTNLNTLLDDFRNNVASDTELPMLLGVDEQYFNISGQEQHEILNAHQDKALNDDFIKFTSMYGYPKSDVTHLTPAGLINHGEDLFDAFQLLLSGVAPYNNCTLTSSGSLVSFDRSTWGQSFTTDCSGELSSITFTAASNPTGSATLTLRNGADCSSTILHTQSINTITTGDITIIPSASIYIDKEHTYYFEITMDNNSDWKITYNNADNVYGMLRSAGNGTDCGTAFPSYDMDFSVEVAELSAPAACVDINNIYSFTYNSTVYEIVKENKSWVDAAACAVERGGILVEINDTLEQQAIFNQLQNNAGITVSNTVAPDGGGASYVWIGANDISTEGEWFWDGDNDNIGAQFWQGGPAASGGTPVGGLYNNWGTEPDNSGNIQDAAGIAITQWPVNSGSLGSAGQWNDIDKSNTLHYIIEYPSTLNTIDQSVNDINVYPNPVNDILTIDNIKDQIKSIEVLNSQGQIIKTIESNLKTESIRLNFSDLNQGIYFISIRYENGSSTLKKVIK